MIDKLRVYNAMMQFLNCSSACAGFLMLLSDTLQLARVPLRGVRSKDDFIGRIKEAVRGNASTFFLFSSFSCDKLLL